MAQWAVIIPTDRWATERLFHHDTVTVPAGATPVAPDDDVLLVADGNVVALARATKTDGDDLVLAYLRRSFDRPVPAAELGLSDASAGGRGTVPADGPGGDPGSGLSDASAAGPGRTPAAGPSPVAVDADVFRRLSAALGGEAATSGRPTWLVSVALPIEAATPAEAVRQFWSHLVELGPEELPAYVWPSGDELAMQAFVLGEEANQDPEEDEDDD